MSQPIFREVFPVERNHFDMAGEASSKIKRMLKQMGIPPAIVRDIAIASYELELNLVIHSLGGTLTLEMCGNQLRLISEDAGPGIPDLTLAMQEGYSTAPESVRDLGFGSGMGLPNIKRHSHRFHIASNPTDGTYITAEYDI